MTPTETTREALADAVTRARRAWERQLPPERLTTVMLAIMIVAGSVLRLWDVDVLPRLGFDEDHFVLNARRYLIGEGDLNNHPPLGKLFIAVGMLIVGDNPAGWRAASIVWGLQTIVVAAVLARELFEDRRAAWFAAAFVAADGFFLSYSRTALLDGGLACLVLWSVLAAELARTWRGVLASAVLVGLAASVKWSGGLVVIPAAALVLARGRVARRWVLLFGTAPVVHLGLWVGALAFSGQPAAPRALVAVIREALHSHIVNGTLQHDAASPWYSWLIFYRPIVLKATEHGTWHHYASCVGHPLLFVGASLGIVVTVGGALAALVSRRARAWVRARCAAGPMTTAAAFLALGWLALIAPWTGPRAYTFVYHYLPSYGFALTLLAGVVAHLERRFPSRVAAFVCAVFLLAAFFAPVWAELRISEHAARMRLVFPAWRP
ncbi:MAG: glycosyl transferase family protein [Myxococcales bacterium]|nr:glycosyl transferase family protein [Myxococcales bacterium]